MTRNRLEAFSDGVIAIIITTMVLELRPPRCISYYIRTLALLSTHSRDAVLATARGRDFKGKISMVIYLVAIPLAFVKAWLACAIYVWVAVMWLVPDRRIERNVPG